MALDQATLEAVERVRHELSNCPNHAFLAVAPADIRAILSAIHQLEGDDGGVRAIASHRRSRPCGPSLFHVSALRASINYRGRIPCLIITF